MQDGAPNLVIGGAALHPRDVAAAALSHQPTVLHPAAWARIGAGYETLLQLAACGTPIYGVSTGLGAAVDTPITPDADQQCRVVLARMVGVGPAATAPQVRAVMVSRLAGFAEGRSGVSPGVVAAYLAVLNSGVVPVMPLIGSIGQADLAPLAHLAAVLVGAGEAEVDGTVLPGADAMARAGIARPVLGPKDGLALVSSNAASVGLATLVLAEAERLFGAWVAAAALSLEGFRGNLAPLHPAAVALRPTPGQAAVAGAMRHMLDGSSLHGAPRRLQDPLSIRCLVPVMGACLAALHGATAAVALELNSSGDNPAVLADKGCMLPTANFDITHLVLALEGLGLAMARVAAAQGARVVQLMSPGASGLPRFLSPVQAGRNGFATLQKTASVLVAETGQLAMPMPAYALPAADGVEDYATMTLSVVRKTAALLDHLRLLCAIELMVAAQACELRPGIALGPRCAAVLAAVRAAVPALHEDRPCTPGVLALAGLVAAGQFGACGAALFDGGA